MQRHRFVAIVMPILIALKIAYLVSMLVLLSCVSVDSGNDGEEAVDDAVLQRPELASELTSDTKDVDNIPGERPRMVESFQSLQPALTELMHRHGEGALPESLHGAYADLDQQVVSGGGNKANLSFNRAPHCCSYIVPLPLVAPQNLCYEVVDNDFNSFFKCVGLIGGSFTMTLGTCIDVGGCNQIDHK